MNRRRRLPLFRVNVKNISIAAQKLTPQDFFNVLVEVIDRFDEVVFHFSNVADRIVEIAQRVILFAKHSDQIILDESNRSEGSKH